MLAFEGVTHRYGRRIALDDVTLRIGAGERVALVGPSGSGKTTLFRLAYAAFDPTQGRVLVGDDDMRSLGGAALRRRRATIAMIFQAHGLIDRLRVWQNVIAGTFGARSTIGALRSVTFPTAAERERVRGALERVGLADRYADRAYGLSGGQRQRVAIARAVIQRAQLVLADEPAASLDPELAHETVRMLLNDARARGATLVCSLHQPELAARFDRVVRLEHGRIVDEGR
ncbi:MAG: phnC [Candidatus Eremiobacteraeota bacterium]|nr:phnC [Candidatus Eremiobacteraeota bacterium]